MRRRHFLAGGKSTLTVCGHETTQQERRFMRTHKPHHINCKRCLAVKRNEHR
jgi:hypothetical protein